MTNPMKFAVALALIFAAIMIAAASINYNSPAATTALPSSAKFGNETPVRATKGDRLDVRPEIRMIAGVTVVLRDFDRIVR